MASELALWTIGSASFAPHRLFALIGQYYVECKKSAEKKPDDSHLKICALASRCCVAIQVSVSRDDACPNKSGTSAFPI